jgi:hypothetical protein
MGKTVAWILSLGLLLLTGWLGFYNGLTEWAGATTLGQKSVTAGVLLYGILGFTTAYGLFRRKGWSFTAAIVWGVVITYVAGAAVLFYGGPDAGIGAALAGAGATALIALGVVWTAKVITRAQPRAPADSSDVGH